MCGVDEQGIFSHPYPRVQGRGAKANLVSLSSNPLLSVQFLQFL